MGVMKRLQQEAKRVSRRTASVGKDRDVIIKSTDINRLLPLIAPELRNNAIRNATRAAARVVKKEAQQTAPRSSLTGTRDKLSRKQQAKRILHGETTDNLARSITIKTKTYDEVVLTMVGPRLPEGWYGYWVEYGHNAVFWGKDSGRRIEPKPFLRPAADSTLYMQKRILEAWVKWQLENV